MLPVLPNLDQQAQLVPQAPLTFPSLDQQAQLLLLVAPSSRPVGPNSHLLVQTLADPSLDPWLLVLQVLLIVPSSLAVGPNSHLLVLPNCPPQNLHHLRLELPAQLPTDQVVRPTLPYPVHSLRCPQQSTALLEVVKPRQRRLHSASPWNAYLQKLSYESYLLK